MSLVIVNDCFQDNGRTHDTGFEYCVTGKDCNGPAALVSPGIASIGQDCLLYKPEHGLFGVFDGAGGATDVGDPRIASTIAAQSVLEYFNESYQSHAYDFDFMQGAMNHARQKVQESKLAGLTTALFFSIKQVAQVTYIDYAVAGDGTVSLFPDSDFDDTIVRAVEWLGPNQTDDYGDPTNVLGNVPGRIQLKDDDFYASKVIKRDYDRYAILATDGVTGDYRRGDGIDEADVEFAFESTLSLRRTADLLVTPPIKRMMSRKIDDKSLVLVKMQP